MINEKNLIFEFLYKPGIQETLVALFDCAEGMQKIDIEKKNQLCRESTKNIVEILFDRLWIFKVDLNDNKYQLTDQGKKITQILKDIFSLIKYDGQNYDLNILEKRAGMDILFLLDQHPEGLKKINFREEFNIGDATVKTNIENFLEKNLIEKDANNENLYHISNLGKDIVKKLAHLKDLILQKTESEPRLPPNGFDALKTRVDQLEHILTSLKHQNPSIIPKLDQLIGPEDDEIMDLNTTTLSLDIDCCYICGRKRSAFDQIWQTFTPLVKAEWDQKVAEMKACELKFSNLSSDALHIFTNLVESLKINPNLHFPIKTIRTDLKSFAKLIPNLEQILKFSNPKKSENQTVQDILNDLEGEIKKLKQEEYTELSEKVVPQLNEEEQKWEQINNQIAELNVLNAKINLNRPNPISIQKYLPFYPVTLINLPPDFLEFKIFNDRSVFSEDNFLKILKHATNKPSSISEFPQSEFEIQRVTSTSRSDKEKKEQEGKILLGHFLERLKKAVILKVNTYLCSICAHLFEEASDASFDLQEAYYQEELQRESDDEDD